LTGRGFEYTLAFGNNFSPNTVTWDYSNPVSLHLLITPYPDFAVVKSGVFKMSISLMDACSLAQTAHRVDTELQVEPIPLMPRNSDWSNVDDVII
jgi:hypothetical protein